MAMNGHGKLGKRQYLRVDAKAMLAESVVASLYLLDTPGGLPSKYELHRPTLILTISPDLATRLFAFQFRRFRLRKLSFRGRRGDFGGDL